MLKGKILVIFFLLSITIFAGSAFALPPGHHFTFKDTVIPDTANPWTHFLDNADFNPDLNGTEPFLIINRARLLLKINFTPQLVDSLNVFVASVTLDGNLLSDKLISYVSLSGNKVKNWLWSTGITNPDALNAIADKQAEIKITPLFGTLDKIKYASLRGAGVVGPEPISMVLVGVGMAGLPIAGRIRRLIKRGNRI